MKKIKMVLMTLFVCVLGYGGYSTYDSITMTNAERFLLENIDALTAGEGSSSITGDCKSSLVVVVDCTVVCPKCGTKWAVNPNVQKAYAQNVSGSCTCGNTDWSNYN